MPESLYPLVFEPIYKDYIWSGSALGRAYPRTVPGGRCGESWEICDRAEGNSTATNGPLSGQRLDTLIARYGAALLGSDVRADRFPLLIKIIDAGDRLSVQVHPDDDSAPKVGAEAKTEMWYALGVQPGCGVYAGLQPGTTEPAFAEALSRGAVEPLLHRCVLGVGDAVFVPGGCVHAICAGCLLLEVQQNSNTTYRVFDWNRLDASGRPRELHVEQAMRVIRWDLPPGRVIPAAASHEGRPRRIAECRHFAMARYDLVRAQAFERSPRAFDVLFVVSGELEVEAGETVTLPAGTSCLIPASLRKVLLRPSGSPVTVLRIAPGARYIS
jgi:mannose-6-phosphate isomerase